MTDPGKSEREPVAAETRASLRAEEVARLAAVHARRRRYWENGYRPIEIWSHDRRFADNGKRLNSPGKQPRGCWREAAKRNPPDAVTRAPYAGATNTGISCEDEIIGADVDVPVQDLADQVVVVAEARFGITPLVRIGLAPKILLVYRAPPAAFGKIQTTELFLPDGTKLKVELLANGQQFVVDGIHPDTGKPYIWTGASPEDVRREELPEITEEAARTFVAEVEELLRAAGAKPREKPGKGTNNPPRPASHPGQRVVIPDRTATASSAWSTRQLSPTSRHGRRDCCRAAIGKTAPAPGASARRTSAAYCRKISAFIPAASEISARKRRSPRSTW